MRDLGHDEAADDEEHVDAGSEHDGVDVEPHDVVVEGVQDVMHHHHVTGDRSQDLNALDHRLSGACKAGEAVETGTGRRDELGKGKAG